VTDPPSAPNGGALCQSSADGAQLGGTFIAFLSDDRIDVRDRVLDDGPWYLVDRTTLVFASKSAIGAAPANRIEKDESGGKPTDFISGTDKFGNVWITSKKSDQGGGSSNQGAPCFAKFSPSGVALFPAPGICFDSTTIGPPLGITTDSAGNAYMGTNYPITILKVDANGNSLYGPAGKVTYRGVTLQYDPTLDRVWVTDDGFTASIKASDGSYVSFNRQAGGATNTNYVTLDGASNLWLTSTTNLGSSLQCSSISAYTPAGVAITTGQTDNGCSLGGLKTDNLVYPQGIAIDAYGNLWVVNYATHLLQKIPAQAVPKVKQTL